MNRTKTCMGAQQTQFVTRFIVWKSWCRRYWCYWKKKKKKEMQCDILVYVNTRTTIINSWWYS